VDTSTEREPEAARAGLQSFGNLAASAVVGVLYTVALPSIAFAYASVLMPIAVVLLLGTNRRARSSSAELAEGIG
jgi:succinate dehydrogenase hydrophobic anchor subunit